MLLPEEIPESEVARLLGVDIGCISRLPTGGQKQVFVVNDGTNKYVIKFVQTTFRTIGTAQYTHYDEFSVRTMRELDLMTNFSSPYLPALNDKIYDVDYSFNNAKFIVFSEDFVGKNSVRKIISSGIGDVTEAKKMIKDIAAAINLYWRQGKIIHRDIKPENIVKSDLTGNYVLIDGGIHYSPQNASITVGVIGTPPYLSPEQVLGQRRDLDPRSDMYSLGLVAYELVTGSHPYFDLMTVGGMQEDQLRDIIVNTKPKAFEDYGGIQLEQGLADIISSLLSKQKFYRPRNPRKLIEAMEELES